MYLLLACSVLISSSAVRGHDLRGDTVLALLYVEVVTITVCVRSGLIHHVALQEVVDSLFQPVLGDFQHQTTYDQQQGDTKRIEEIAS